VKTLISSLKLSEINRNDELQNIIIKETLINFDQILRLSTIYIWETHTEKLKLSEAATNLKSKILAIETTNASETTALAIQRATENINNTNQLNLNTNLRLSNLEKSFT
jgi:hypothetical protein